MGKPQRLLQYLGASHLPDPEGWGSKQCRGSGFRRETNDLGATLQGGSKGKTAQAPSLPPSDGLPAGQALLGAGRKGPQGWFRSATLEQTRRKMQRARGKVRGRHRCAMGVLLGPLANWSPVWGGGGSLVGYTCCFLSPNPGPSGSH